MRRKTPRIRVANHRSAEQITAAVRTNPATFPNGFPDALRIRGDRRRGLLVVSIVRSPNQNARDNDDDNNRADRQNYDLDKS